jgi:hypothetical protein
MQSDEDTTNVIIRNIPTSTLKEIDRRASEANQSRQAFLLSYLIETMKEPEQEGGECVERKLIAYTWQGGKYAITSKCKVELIHEYGPPATEAELHIIERAKTIAESGSAKLVEWAKDFLGMHGFDESDLHEV